MTREARSILCPESVLGWIPWYGESVEDGRSLLSDRQRGAVEAHASECSDCRAEIDMIAGAPFETDVELPDPDRVFEAITARIDAGEAESPGSESMTPVIPIDRARGLDDTDYGKLARWVLDDSSESSSARSADRFSNSTRIERPWIHSTPFAAAAAIALLFVGGMGGVLFKSASSNPDSEVGYELANIDSTAVAAPAIDVVFVDSASVSQISEALRDVGVEIVSGPSHLGVYRVRLGPAQTDDGVASAPDAAAIAAHLKANVTPIVIFAEPVP